MILDILGKVGFEWQMALFNLINFMIVFGILKYFAFTPIQRTIRERQQKAREAVEQFEKSKTVLGEAEQKAQQLVDEAKVEANSVREQATDDATQIGEKMKTKAKSEIELLINQAKRNIEIDKQQMEQDVRKKSADLVTAATAKIIGEKLDAKKDGALIEDALKQMS